jgi:predicted metal-dependent peptidase
MSKEELERCLAETAGILALYRRPIRVLCCDADIHLDKDSRDVREIHPTGGGGSDTRPVFQRLEDDPGRWGRPSLVIYFTDLWVQFPEDPPPYPVIWVNTDPERAKRAPFGTEVRLEVEAKAGAR